MPRGREHGASAVEFALILPLLIVLVFGIIEFGLAFSRLQGLQAAAREGGRVAAVAGDEDDVRDRIQEVAPAFVAFDDLDIGLVPTGGCQSGVDTVTVAVQVGEAARSTYSIRIPLLPNVEPSYETQAVFRCERTR